MARITDGPYVDPSNDWPRRKRGEYDPPKLPPTSSDLLREIYATDPSDPRPRR